MHCLIGYCVDCSYSFSCVVCIDAVHRYYESRRRLFNDEQPSRIEAAKKTRLKSRAVALRKQVYRNYTFIYLAVLLSRGALINAINIGIQITNLRNV